MEFNLQNLVKKWRVRRLVTQRPYHGTVLVTFTDFACTDTRQRIPTFRHVSRYCSTRTWPHGCTHRGCRLGLNEQRVKLPDAQHGICTTAFKTTNPFSSFFLFRPPFPTTQSHQHASIIHKQNTHLAKWFCTVNRLQNYKFLYSS
jgi:hypothetical protein